jgi:chloramphenicol 3-O phosphotransferase
VRAPGFVVVLDGPSGVGKSETLAALQGAWPQIRSGPLVDVGLDRATAALGPRALARWWELIQHVEPPPPEVAERVVWGPLGRELVGGMHRAAASWAHAGFDVVVDHVLLDRTTARDLVMVLAGLPVVHVGLVCDEDVLEAREVEGRGGSVGRAVVQQRQSRDLLARDLVLDTSETTTEELVAEILSVVAERAARAEQG